MPPMAAATGRIARRGDDRCPASSSRLISSPTTKKNTTMSASLIQCWSESARTREPIPIEIRACEKWKYAAAHGEFAHTIAAAAHAISTALPATAEWMNQSITLRGADGGAWLIG